MHTPAVCFIMFWYSDIHWHISYIKLYFLGCILKYLSKMSNISSSWEVFIIYFSNIVCVLWKGGCVVYYHIVQGKYNYNFFISYAGVLHPVVFSGESSCPSICFHHWYFTLVLFEYSLLIYLKINGYILCRSRDMNASSHWFSLFSPSNKPI